MSGWLVDTNVLSAFAPGRRAIEGKRASWFRERADELFLSTVTAMEIETGIAGLQRAGARERAEALQTWFALIIEGYADRILPFDLAAARAAGGINDAARTAGRHPGLADVMIAAIARSRELVVLTANVRHFEPLGVATLNPFASD